MTDLIQYSLTIKDNNNTNELILSIKDNLVVNDQLYIKKVDNIIKFYTIIKSDISELDTCIGYDNLLTDSYKSTFVIKNVLYIIERKPVVHT